MWHWLPQWVVAPVDIGAVATLVRTAVAASRKKTACSNVEAIGSNLPIRFVYMIVCVQLFLCHMLRQPT